MSLFAVKLDADELYETYLSSFKDGDNQIFRKRTEHDCSACKSFIKRYGSIVIINKNKIYTIWDFVPTNDKYKPVCIALDNFVKKHTVDNVFVSLSKNLGIIESKELMESHVHTWSHLNLILPNKFVKSIHKDTFNTYLSDQRDRRNVFKASLDKIDINTIAVVLELILDEAIYRGKEYMQAILEFQNAAINYQNAENKELFAWEYFNKYKHSAKIKNTAVGTLLLNIAEGMDIELAVKKFEEIMAPENYKRPKPVFTKAMLEKAKQQFIELGYGESLNRRFARIEDIDIKNILFKNADTIVRKVAADPFEMLENGLSINPSKIKYTEVKMDHFIENILPTQSYLELLFENNLSKKIMAMITAKNEQSKSMFKWPNNFSWSYVGGLADSSMKENVKKAGGTVDAFFRCSLQWNDIVNEYDRNDLDLHCITPLKEEIMFCNKFSKTGGRLDVDIISPIRGVPAVENIFWKDKATLTPGIYEFSVVCYSYSGGTGGFKAEIEINGELHEFTYGQALKQSERVIIAKVHYDGVDYRVEPVLPSQMSSREQYNLMTNQFVPVQMVMYSPNYWDTKIGNKHTFFILRDCKIEEPLNAFYNEFMSNDLTDHRKVIEGLISATKIIPSSEANFTQVAGVGFSDTQDKNVIVRVTDKNGKQTVYKLK